MPPTKTKISRGDWATSNSVCRDVIYNLECWSWLANILPTTAEGLKARTMALEKNNIFQNFSSITFP